MRTPYLDLNNQDLVWQDKGLRSIAYFCKKLPVHVDQGLINELKKLANTFKDKNLRLCLHDSPQALFQNMIILERKEKYYRPHKHFNKGESLHIIEGKMAVFTFNDSGEVTDYCILGKGKNIIYKVAANSYHVILPLTKLIIYHEANTGPFLGQGNNIFSSWSPEEQFKEEIAEYKQKLLRLLRKETKR